MSTTTYIIIMAVCLLLSAYFSATETAFSSANVTRLKMLAEKGNSRAALACRLLERYDKLLSTILIGNNIVNIAMASLATALFVKSFGDAGATLSTIVVTVVVLIFGEISPKSIAKDCAENWAMTAAPFLRCLIWLLMPLNALFSLWKKLLARMFHLDGDNKMSPDEMQVYDIFICKLCEMARTQKRVAATEKNHRQREVRIPLLPASARLHWCRIQNRTKNPAAQFGGQFRF